jgi:hypothetical protein
MKAKTILTSTASLGVYLGAVLCLVSTTVSSPHPVQLPLIDGTAPPRNMQQSSSTDFLYLNFASVLQSIEDHLRSAPVQRNIHRLFQSRVQFGGEEHSYPSVQYTFDGFWSSWKDNMQNKLLIAGDNIERNMTVKVYSDRGKRLPDQAIIISGFEYGLANMAAFLAQAMVDGIYSDECSVLSSMAENQCSSLSEKERWAIPIKSWQKVQDYSNSNWDYKQQLVDYVDRGMNRLEYNPDHRKIDYGFIQSVSGVYQSGCHDVDSEGNIGSCPSSSSGLVGKMSQRRTAFATALSALCIPRLREIEIVKTTLEYLKGRKEGFVDNLLLYKRGEDLYPSQRCELCGFISLLGWQFLQSFISFIVLSMVMYGVINSDQFDDMVSAIEVFSIPSNVTMPTVDETKKYFQSPDHQAFYMGDPYMQYGHKYGLGNIALFFANGLHLSIEKDDACDEQNEHEVYGKLPISNSCGQYEVSYQDMVCSDESPNMACTVDENMELTAVTFGRLIGSPPPLTCAPKSQIKYTGFWNSELVREEKFEAYANQHGRVDVSGCCWWGRGVLQTKGVCAFGRLNHYIGASAKNLGQPSLFPTIDFCTNPEAICSSIYSRELTWMSGLFLWIDQVQPYDQGDFNYMNELHEFADSGFRDEDFIIKTNNIVKFGCHNPPCQNSGCMGSTLCLASSSSDEDTGNFVTKAYRTFMEVDLWSFPDSEGGSNMPSPSPTRCKVGCTKEPTFAPFNPTSNPSTAPVVDPTQSPTASPFSEGDERMEYFLYVKMILDNKKEEIEKEIFTTPNIPIFTFDGFFEALEYVSTIEPEGLVFFLGKDRTSNLGHGLANIALFLAHASTRGMLLYCADVNKILVFR